MESRRFLPIGLDVRDKPCVVVGGGVVGTRKAFNLIRGGAHVTVVAPTVSEELAQQIAAGRVRWIEEAFAGSHVSDAFLTIAATNDDGINAAVVAHGARAGALVCDASSAERSEVIFAALHQAGDATVAVFTDGRDPGLARRIRDRIAALLAGDVGSSNGR